VTEFRVHPNSMAARKWGRTTWTSSSTTIFARAASARRAGDVARADALRRAGARRAATESYCG